MANKIIKLDKNENPFLPPPYLMRNIKKAISKINIYPTDLYDKIIKLISKKFDIPSNRIYLSNGFDEAFDLLIDRFRNKRFVLFLPTFYGFIERLNLKNKKFKIFRLDKNFNIRKKDILSISKNDFVVLANPNNPTGNLFNKGSLESIFKRSGKILIDETYIDFSGSDSYLKYKSEDFWSLSRL